MTAALGVVADTWYADALADAGVESFERLIAARMPGLLARLACRWPALRGALCWWLARDAQRVVFSFASRGLWAFLLLEAAWRHGPRRVVLVEFLRGAARGRLGPVKEALHDALYRRLLPRTVLGAQVMTRWEEGHYAAKYGVAPRLFRFIAFPMMIDAAPLADDGARDDAYVLASGRAACDWPTLFAAAEGAPWRLTVVCSREDRPLVDALNRGRRATVLSEIAQDAHRALLERCTVYALVLREQHASSGQVRLARAVEAGVPVVATAVLGLDGYLQDGVTGLAVASGAAPALREAIERLLGDPMLRQALRRRAHDAMRSRSLPSYVDDIRRFVFAA